MTDMAQQVHEAHAWWKRISTASTRKTPCASR